MTHTSKLADAQRYWDEQAATFDQAPDHGLEDPRVHEAWTACLARWLPPPPTAVLDLGCGTGSVSVVLAALGYEVTGIDLSPEMIRRAEHKVASRGQQVRFAVMEASDPPLPEHGYDVLFCRHLLWTLPEPARVLQRWTRLLRRGGRLILVEGFWSTGAGLHASELLAALPAGLGDVSVQDLSPNHDLWGGEVADERYVVSARHAHP